MKAKLKRFAPLFANDLKQAVDYYDDISTRTGNGFREEVESKLDLVASTSEGFATVYNEVRALRLRKFPYMLLYRSFARHVEFLGLVHGSKARSHWFERMD